MQDQLSAVSQPLPAHDAAGAVSHKSAEKIAHENNKLHKRLCRQVGQAIGDFNMIEDGDKVMVCLSGGKDSYALLDILMTLRERAPINFEIVAVNLDQKQPNFPDHILPAYLDKLGVAYHIENQDTYSIVKRLIPEGKTTCSLCSRLRRGILYRVADELGATKIALGHHRDDVLQTLFLNLMFAGQLAAMPPRLVAKPPHAALTVIRPLAYCGEDDIRAFAELAEFPILPCDLCGSQEKLQRKRVGRLIDDLERERPGTKGVMLAALQNVKPTHLLDRALLNLLERGEPPARPSEARDRAPTSESPARPSEARDRARTGEAGEGIAVSEHDLIR